MTTLHIIAIISVLSAALFFTLWILAALKNDRLEHQLMIARQSAEIYKQKAENIEGKYMSLKSIKKGE